MAHSQEEEKEEANNNDDEVAPLLAANAEEEDFYAKMMADIAKDIDKKETIEEVPRDKQLDEIKGLAPNKPSKEATDDDDFYSKMMADLAVDIDTDKKLTAELPKVK